MSGTTWGKWFWSDWMSDPGVRVSSYAARGLWMDMLCIAAENDGFVAVKGKPLSPREIARATGGEEAEVAGLIDELEKNGVFSRDKRKCIYSRRMIRDEKKSRIARENGKKGGLASVEKQKEIPASGGQKPKPQSPESRIQKPEKREAKTLPPAAGGGLFEESAAPSPKPDWPIDYHEQFWRNYPKRTEKKAAMAKLDAVRKSGVPWAHFMAGVLRYLQHVSASRTEERFIKHPTTWLNKGCWDDQLGPVTAPVGKNGMAELRREMRERRQREEIEHEPEFGDQDGGRVVPPEVRRGDRGVG